MKEEDFKAENTHEHNSSLLDSPPDIFQHLDLLTAIDNNRIWELKKLVNKLNYINFKDGYVFFVVNHKETGQYILIKAYPQPCVNNELTCRIAIPDTSIDLTVDKLDYFFIDDGVMTILAPVELMSSQGDTVKVKLPEKSYINTKRKTKRFFCNDIICKVVQGDFNARAELIDYSPSGLGIKLTRNGSMNGFEKSKSALINLTRNGVRLFSGLCHCSRNGINSPNSRVVFTPLNEKVPLFTKREMRNPRRHINPSFKVSFRHPFFQGNVERDIFEISTSGFSLRDSKEEETLLPGMIIPRVTIVYAGIVKIYCSTQVVYREEDKENKIVKCGLAIMDMDVQSYSHLNHILGVYLDGYARVSTEMDMDALWEFFFDTGFIYGEKYQHLQSYRDTFKETYRKLYQESPDIAKHFVYEENCKIYGHIAMVHAYKSSWLIHHFAARPLKSKIPGFMILRQVTNYINGFHRFPSGGMDYVMTYYQPENRIIDKIFGGFTRYLNNQEGSSLDLFSYLHYQKSSLDQELPAEWLVRECHADDFRILTNFYDGYSGGLMLSALGLASDSTLLREAFMKAGFKRNCQTFCLCNRGQQAAFFIVNQSDLGLNLSDLLNGIKILIVDKELQWEIITTAISKLNNFYTEDRIPLLVYPSTYLSEQGISADKNYQLWILKNNPYSDQYTEYMSNNFRMKYRNT